MDRGQFLVVGWEAGGFEACRAGRLGDALVRGERGVDHVQVGGQLCLGDYVILAVDLALDG